MGSPSALGRREGYQEIPEKVSEAQGSPYSTYTTRRKLERE